MTPIYPVTIFDCPPFQLLDFQDCHRAVEIRDLGRFEPESMALWCRLARTATGILDIGAQVGVYSLAAGALRKDIPIHAFEPNPDAYARLATHRHINGFENIVCHREAVADVDGVIGLSWLVKGELISSGASLGGREGLVTVPCRVAKLDGFGIDLGERGLVKIDVEGAEAVVLAGAAVTLGKRPDIILETFSANACLRWNYFVAANNYRVYKILETERRMVPVDVLSPCARVGGDFNHYLEAAR